MTHIGPNTVGFGQLVAVHQARCARCGKTAQVGTHAKTEAAERLTRAGWRRCRLRGFGGKSAWHCWDCSAGRICVGSAGRDRA